MDLFVYGTLLSPALMAAVAGTDQLRPVPAVLPGYTVRPVAGNVVPFVVQEDGAAADGTIWQDLTDDQMVRLDAYEGAFGYVLTPLQVLVDGKPVACHCYLPPKGIRAGQGDWSLQDWEAGHLAPAIFAAAELFSHRPLPDHATLRRMWPMIEGRAWAKHRATAAPAVRRMGRSIGCKALM